MLPPDQIRFFTGILISIPFSFCIRFIQGYQLRKYYSLIIGLILEYYVYGNQFVLPIILHFIMYNLIKGANRQYCGLYATITSMMIVSTYHIYVMIVDYGRWEIDTSTILMMSVCKYSLFAFSYQDGKYEPEDSKNKQRLNEKIKQLPSFQNFLSYMTFLPSALGNTPFDYANYQRFMKREQQFQTVPIKLILIRFGKQFLGLLICLAIYIFATIYFPTNVFGTESYLEKGNFHNFWYSFVATNLLATKYFFGFKLMQLPIHASGVSYKPSMEREDQFEGIRTIDIIPFENAFHLRDKVANWNIAVQQWLRRCVYQRLNYGKSANQLITFMVSAFWHGYYPGYYVTFGLYFLQIYAGNLIYKFSKTSPKHPIVQTYNNSGKVGHFVVWLSWIWIFVNNSIYFPALSGQKAWKLLTLMKFANPIFLIVLIIFFHVITPKKRPQKLKE